MILELREALLAAQSQFLEYPSVVGVAPDKDPETGEYRIAILIYHWQIEGPKSGQPTAMAWRQRIPNE
ncbi:MAG: hypothetical protein GX295_03805, partial [Syntrophomonadaceae bacterium]|nr:hypothetical protein [Syntrophomonadaceae bacterium]